MRSRRGTAGWAVVCAAAVVGAAWAGEGPATASVADYVMRAGNADTDAERLAVLRELAAVPELGKTLGRDVGRLIAEVELYMTSPRLDYFGQTVRKSGKYDFGIAEDSPLYPLTQIYQARMDVWVTLEYGGYWSHPDVRRERFDAIRPVFEELRERFPENRLIRMYLGEPIPAPIQYEAVAGAPEWAVYQREGLERLADIVEWWIDHRLQENGEYGGGWGDDCEMWRFWVPVLTAFDDAKITGAQAKFSDALMSQPHMSKGYTTYLHDVEHTAEDSSDAMLPMMLLDPDDEVWSRRALRLAELMRDLWAGINERGQFQFKSTYFNVERVSDDPRRACDTVYHARALEPVALYWQRTGDAELGKLFTAWMDTWVDATARAERGKPAGVVPSAIHWPDGGIGGLGEKWWDPENHTSDPLYVWPSSMGGMLDTMLLTYVMTGNEKYLEPLRSMARIRLEYLEHPPAEEPERGSRMWCASKMAFLRDVLAKYRLLTGNPEFDPLFEKDSPYYLRYRLNGELDALAGALRQTAESMRINFEGYTSEVRYTDRVVRFPALFEPNCMFPEGRPGFGAPKTHLLYATVTGDPGSALICPLNAVRWLTRPRELAALVVEASDSRFEADLFHFGTDPRPMGAELYGLKPGRYALALAPEGGAAQDRPAFEVAGQRTRIAFELPARKLCRLAVSRLDPAP
ncbi:MAG: hypothetical protein JXR94_15960 [Candidatus Hydrogenedentes bacterium]|nr:hypothetical protein [Candidatus Hydrogenedentota bacterium]